MSTVIDITGKHANATSAVGDLDRINRETAFFSLYTGTILILVVIFLSSQQPVAPIVRGYQPVAQPQTDSVPFNITQDEGVEALAQFLSLHDRQARCYVTGPGSLRGLLQRSFEYSKKLHSHISLNVVTNKPLAKFFVVPLPKVAQGKELEVLCQIEH